MLETRQDGFELMMSRMHSVCTRRLCYEEMSKSPGSGEAKWYLVGLRAAWDVKLMLLGVSLASRLFSDSRESLACFESPWVTEKNFKEVVRALNGMPVRETKALICSRIQTLLSLCPVQEHKRHVLDVYPIVF